MKKMESGGEVWVHGEGQNREGEGQGRVGCAETKEDSEMEGAGEAGASRRAMGTEREAVVKRC